MPFFAPITLTTPRLVLRPIRDEDASALFAVWSDAEAMRYFSFLPMHCLDQAKERIARASKRSAAGEELICVLCLRTTGDVVGDCALSRADVPNRRAEIGFCLQRQHWGHGYMREATSALIDHALTALNLHRIEADIDPRNLASARLLKRLGFVREGLLRERWSVGDEVSDSELYGLLERDRRVLQAT
ncbi:MAG: GNAT family N-acetyltransferase [Janthinobacterium lividum]